MNALLWKWVLAQGVGLVLMRAGHCKTRPLMPSVPSACNDVTLPFVPSCDTAREPSPGHRCYPVSDPPATNTVGQISLFTISVTTSGILLVPFLTPLNPSFLQQSTPTCPGSCLDTLSHPSRVTVSPPFLVWSLQLILDLISFGMWLVGEALIKRGLRVKGRGGMASACLP